MAQILLDAGADIDAKDNRGNTPLILAIKKHNLTLVQFVVVHGVDVNLANAERISLLHQAAYTGDEKVAAFLLKAGADPFVKNADGYTPLDFARAKKNSAVANELKNYMGKRK